MIYKLTTIDSVIGRILQDLGWTEEIPEQDFIVWIIDALKHIGSYYQFKEKIATIEINNFKGELPCDFYQLISKTSNGTYDNFNKGLIVSGDLDNVQEQINTHQFSNKDYNINLDHITTSYQTGNITIKYLAFPVCERGLPMVPDDISFSDAFFWKVCSQLAIQGYEFKNTQLRNIDYCRKKWNFYCMQARGNANMPDAAMMNRVAKRWISLLPNLNAYDTYNASLNTIRRIDLNGRD